MWDFADFVICIKVAYLHSTSICESTYVSTYFYSGVIQYTVQVMNNLRFLQFAKLLYVFKNLKTTDKWLLKSRDSKSARKVQRVSTLDLCPPIFVRSPKWMVLMTLSFSFWCTIYGQYGRSIFWWVSFMLYSKRKANANQASDWLMLRAKASLEKKSTTMLWFSQIKPN